MKYLAKWTTNSWKQRYFQFLRRLAAQLTLVLLMTVINLAILMTELSSNFHAESIVNKLFKSKKTDNLDNLFINQSLCPNYRILWSKSKRLHSMSIINILYIYVGTLLKVKITEKSRLLAISHLYDLKVNFPIFQPPSESS